MTPPGLLDLPATEPVAAIPTRAVLDALLDPLFLLKPRRDDSGKIVDFTVIETNSAAAEYHQRERTEIIGCGLLDFLPGDNASALMAMARDAHESGEPLVVNNYAFALEIYGRERRFDIRAVRINDELLWTWRDVTERYLAAKRLAASEERYRLLAENSSDVVVRIRRGTIQWISPSVYPSFGYDIHECLGRPATDFLEPDDRAPCAEHLARLAEGHSIRVRKIVCAKDGTRHWVETHASPYYNEAGHPDGFVATTRIIDEQVANELQLEHRARTDELTELLNRKEALSRIETLGAQTRRSGHKVAVLFCDLDYFKQINDHHGHAVGDEVLRAMATRLRSTLRTSDDLAARLGGDELLVVLHGVHDLPSAMEIAEKLRTAAAEPVPTTAGAIRTTMSIGVTLARDGETSDTLVARADSAMYRAKQNGRNRIFSLDGPMEATP